MDGHSGDPYALQRFVDAQDGVYDQVCSELRQGLKMTHWIWFIFPQISVQHTLDGRPNNGLPKIDLDCKGPKEIHSSFDFGI